MNSLITPTVKLCISSLLFAVFVLTASKSVALDVDLSRRAKDFQKFDQEFTGRLPASLVHSAAKLPPDRVGQKILGGAMTSVAVTSDYVILHTDQGFVPSQLRLKKDGAYRISVVNVSEKDKNVSFLIDSFSEHHATYFGKVKSFMVTPKAEGIFSYQCPETGAQGQVVIYSEKNSGRAIANAEGE